MGWSRLFRSSIFSALAFALVASASAQSFVNWESPHVSPLSMTPDGATLLAVNTADNRVEIFDVTLGIPVWQASVPVGLDPVSVRARSNTEAWVADHVSDTVSIVDLTARAVVKTLAVGDEPTDIAFANGRAFVTLSQLNQVKVYDLANLAAAPTVLSIQGEDPRALAVGPGGATVYAAIWDSGNMTTIVSTSQVSSPGGPYGGQNPPPNSGTQFVPPQRLGNPTPPPVSLIVRRDPVSGQWRDVNGRNWSSFVTWNLHDHDLVAINTASLAVTYINGLMTLDMHLTVRPDGRVVVVGTEALNQVRFEPNHTGRFVRSRVALVDTVIPAQTQLVDLNPHLADEYVAGVGTIPPGDRLDSIADPRGVAWRADGTAGYIAGMGSNSVVVIGQSGERLARIDVGQGPTGLAIDDARSRLYVLNKFDGTISVIDTGTNTEMTVVPFFDPTPPLIRAGRPFQYDALLTSGLGVTACNSCHIDVRFDPLAWDLGNPAGLVEPFDEFCQGLECNDWHPMKGPMRTQTMQGLADTEPFHWRGDREDLAAFNVAFVGLMGRESELTPAEMADYVAFVESVKFPPNPNRNVDNSLKTSLAGGNPTRGEILYTFGPYDDHSLSCNQCHLLPTGTNRNIAANNTQPTGLAAQATKNAQLRSVYEKTGFDKSSNNNNLGFGLSHDGTTDTLFNFLKLPFFNNFNVNSIGPPHNIPPTGDQGRRDVAAFMLSLGTDTHAGVGVQVTLDDSNKNDPPTIAVTNQMLSLADAGKVGVVVRGRQGGLLRGYRYNGGGVFQSDRAAETIGSTSLRLAAANGSELTWTMVPLGSQTRIGIDRDGDGFFDRDEIDGCGDPANASVGPGHYVACDSNCDGGVDFFDIDPFVTALFAPVQYQLTYPACSLVCNNDASHDGTVDFFDIDGFLSCLFP